MSRETRLDAGYTLIELVVATAIIAVVTSVLGMILYQMLALPRQGNDQLAVDSDLRNAGLWLMRDGSESQRFTGSAPCTSFVFDTGPVHGAVYTYTLNGETLRRDDGTRTIGVARHVAGLDCPSGTVTEMVAIALTAASDSVSASQTYTVALRVH